MSALNMIRALSVVLAGLALAAIVQISHAARDVESETPIAGVAGAHAGRGSPVTLYLEDSSGNAFRLVHVQDAGWRYAEGWKSPDGAAAPLFRKVAFGSTTPAPAKRATPEGEPLTVFIDGPSGFTFVWDREGSWKFVGKIAHKSP